MSRSLTTSVTFSNSGSLTVNAGTLQVAKYTQIAGSTTVAKGATLKSGGSGTQSIIVNGGIVTGNGTLNGALTGGGTYVPGRSAGALKVSGGFTPTGTATVLIGLSGSSNPGADFGQLAFTGTATLAGTLAIKTATGYLPPVGATVPIVTAAKTVGAFSSITGIQLTGEHWTVSYTSTGVVLIAVQWIEPTGYCQHGNVGSAKSPLGSEQHCCGPRVERRSQGRQAPSRRKGTVRAHPQATSAPKTK